MRENDTKAYGLQSGFTVSDSDREFDLILIDRHVETLDDPAHQADLSPLLGTAGSFQKFKNENVASKRSVECDAKFHLGKAKMVKKHTNRVGGNIVTNIVLRN